MKFLRIHLSNQSDSYYLLEGNCLETHWLLYSLLNDECFYEAKNKFILELLEQSFHDGWFYGDQVMLKREHNIIEIRDSFEDHEDAIQPPTILQIDRQQLIIVIQRWAYLTINLDNLPQNIIIIQNEAGDVALEATTDADPRFSRLANNNEPPYAFIEKSDSFDNYWRVEANQGSLFKFARVLGDYLSNKKRFKEWLANEDQQCLRYSNLLSLCPNENNNNAIEIDLKIWHDKDINIVEYPLAKNHFTDLLDESDRLINLLQKNERIMLTPENNKVKLTIQKINSI